MESEVNVYTSSGGAHDGNMAPKSKEVMENIFKYM